MRARGGISCQAMALACGTIATRAAALVDGSVGQGRKCPPLLSIVAEVHANFLYQRKCRVQ